MRHGLDTLNMSLVLNVSLVERDVGKLGSFLMAQESWSLVIGAIVM